MPCIIAYMDTVKEKKNSQLLETFENLRITYKTRNYNWVWIMHVNTKGMPGWPSGFQILARMATSANFQTI